MKTPLKLLTAALLAALLAAFLTAGAVTKPYEREDRPDEVLLVQSATDTVRNPYAPPVRSDEPCNYTQMGFLARDGSPQKLALFGKRAPNRDKWYYYTNVNGIKLPVEFKQKKCTASPGCDEVGSRDQVVVDGVPYEAHLYEKTMYDYDPFDLIERPQTCCR
jgi:hypothetical protein